MKLTLLFKYVFIILSSGMNLEICAQVIPASYASGTNYNYTYDFKTNYTRDYTSGTFISDRGVIGIFRNGYVLNKSGKMLGSLSKGSFMNEEQKCLGYLKGNRLLSCDGDLIAYINRLGVYNTSHDLIYKIRGETLYSNDYPVLQISGLDKNAIAVYLLMFSDNTLQI